MSKGIASPKKNKSSHSDISLIKSSIDKDISDIFASFGVAHKNIFKTSNQNITNKRNLNGRFGEELVYSEILKLVSFYPIDCFNKPNDVRIKLTSEVSTLVCQSSLVPDLMLFNKHSNNTIYIEVKNLKTNGSIVKSHRELVTQYNYAKKHVLFVVTGDYYNSTVIDKFNTNCFNRNPDSFSFMIHQKDLKTFIDYWANCLANDFKTFNKIYKNS